MKCVALALFSVSVLMIVPANAHGQSIKDQMAAINTEAAPFLAVREANRKTFADLSQQLDDINLGNAALAKGATQYKADLAEYQMDIDAFDQAGAAQDKAVDAHNAHKCTYSQGSNACDRYNQEKNRLDAVHQQLIDQQASLASRKANLAATADKFRELQKIISDKTEKYMVAQKAYNAQNEENEAKLAGLKARYDALLEKLKPCLAKLPPDPSEEKLHEVCGQLWDGNSIHSAPVNQGTGGITPNK